jgi:CopG family nickel-responsive transcriptional regulator
LLLKLFIFRLVNLDILGGSEVIRAGARLLISDFKDREKIIGKINAILLLINSTNSEDVVTNIKHNFEDVTFTQIHCN